MDKKTLSPMTVIDEDVSPEEVLSFDQLVLLIYLHFYVHPRRKTTRTSLLELYGVLGSKITYPNARLNERIDKAVKGLEKMFPLDSRELITFEAVKFNQSATRAPGLHELLEFKSSFKLFRKEEKTKLYYLELNDVEFGKLLEGAETGECSLKDLIIAYTYMKSHFSTVINNNTFYGWSGWQHEELCLRDLQVNNLTFRKQRRILEEVKLLFSLHAYKNATLYVTENSNRLKIDVFKRYKRRYGKDHEQELIELCRNESDEIKTKRLEEREKRGAEVAAAYNARAEAQREQEVQLRQEDLHTQEDLRRQENLRAQLELKLAQYAADYDTVKWNYFLARKGVVTLTEAQEDVLEVEFQALADEYFYGCLDELEAVNQKYANSIGQENLIKLERVVLDTEEFNESVLDDNLSDYGYYAMA